MQFPLTFKFIICYRYSEYTELLNILINKHKIIFNKYNNL